MLELEHGFRALDVHARLPVGDETMGPERLERELRQAGVLHAVVSAEAAPESGLLAANNAVARGCVDRPFVAFARLGGPRKPPTDAVTKARNLVARDAEISPDDIQQLAIDDRFHGFVIDPGQDGLPDEAGLDELDDAGLPVIVHGGESFPPALVAETLLDRSFPVVVAHFGGYPLRRDLMERAVGLLDVHEQCYLDTSHVRHRTVLETAIREHPDRILFGSGTPMIHPTVAVTELLTLDVPEDGMRKVFTNNPARVIDALATA
jgi:predicted TIM-barrel fold metal-dependent hydrolase